MNVRRILLWLHRWAGILAGLVILLVGATGAALVFERQLSRWQQPELYPRGGSGGDRSSIARALDDLKAKHPDARVQGIMLPRDDADALRLFAGTRAMHVDPRTGEQLGWRPRRGGLTPTLVKLHVSLMAGTTGGTVVAVATMLTLALAVTGLWLWWPLRIGWFRRGRDFRRFNLDLHSVAGLYSSAFIIVVAVTGLTVRYLHVEHPPVPQSNPAAGTQRRITSDEAIRRAEAALPGAHAVSLELPAPNPRAPYRVQLAFPEDGSPAGRSVVFLDQFAGDVLSVHNAREGTWLERYGNLQLSLHTGSIGGLATQWLAFLVCVALVLQVFSGYVLWWKRPRQINAIE
ncbi:MAG: PepSY-associated TM helix domain-containing protein [Chthoniobacteraceae bacterium]